MRYRPNGRFHWGRQRLIRMVEAAAAHVARTLPRGPPLVVGDLSARAGGKIPRHSSHRTGRDVDLLTKRSVQQSHNWIRRQEILTSAEVVYESR